MTQIKVCGITNIDDAMAAAASGADALGFIFHRPSPRCVPPGRAAEIIAALPSGVVTVGVFVNRPAREIIQVADRCGLDMIQLHGDERPADCRPFPPERLIKAFSPRTPEETAALAAYPVRAFLIDARQGERYGGTGKRADWMLAALIVRRYALVLAGGLNETNVAAALAAVAPAAVDLNSGVERAPGMKDEGKLRRTIGIIRAADGSRGNPAGPVVFVRTKLS
jgi:phosphoribosylanthranilate isomerase